MRNVSTMQFYFNGDKSKCFALKNVVKTFVILRNCNGAVMHQKTCSSEHTKNTMSQIQVRPFVVFQNVIEQTDTKQTFLLVTFIPLAALPATA